MARPKSSSLRIIAGRWRGRRVSFSAIESLRPTPNRVRETLFNWLDPVIAGSTCLDLFAGSGLLTFEALSRGAASVTAVDHSREVVRQLEGEHARLDGEQGAGDLTLVAADALEWLRAGTGERAYDVVFIDPPFGTDMATRCCRLLADQGWLTSNASVYIESERAIAEEELPTGWRIRRSKRASQVHFCLCEVS